MRALLFGGLLLILWPACVWAEDIQWIWPDSGAPARASSLAVVLEHLRLSGAEVEVHPRARRLVLPPGAVVTPVVHVQTDPLRGAQWNARQLSAIGAAMTSAVPQASSGWVQLDFEPTERERESYLALVKTLRGALPASLRLSVTVMAAWCGEPALLDRIAADEIVPMFFRMGPDSDTWRRTLLYTPQRLDRRCRGEAAGFALQERPPAAVAQRYARRYWFSYTHWDAGAIGE